MSSLITEFFAPRVHRIDEAILKLTNGKYTGTELLGWPIIQLKTIGARTNQLRTTPLVGIPTGNKIVLIATSFGRKHNPGWYNNLKAHPECEVLFKGHLGKYIAREANGEEYIEYWKLALYYYKGYEKYQERAACRHIPVMVLEPKK